MTSQQYFQSYNDYFWQWEEGGAVVGIPEGRTIAYREYLIEAMEAIQDDGLPRFGTLLLLLLAASGNAQTDITRLCVGLRARQIKAAHIREFINSGQDFLLELSKLPPAYRSGKNRLLLLQALIRPFHGHISPEKAGEMIQHLRSHAYFLDQGLNKIELDDSVLAGDFRYLSHLSRVFPTAEYIVKAMASLPEIEEGIVDPEEPEGGEQGFVQQLLENPSTFHIGALIPRLWSGLSIPRHHRLPGSQPLGGVSGLSNKGDYHRLLVSELAQDDIVFLSRLANNEALYFNREAPPQADSRERAILIDVSIKSWGTPRALAFALLLAIARHPKNDIPCSAFAVGDQAHPLAFGDIHEIIKSLQALAPCLHPAHGLEAFFREYPDKKAAEVIFITPAETLQLPAMQQAMDVHHSSFDYWIQTDSQGKISLHKKQQQGRKHIQTIRLPLRELWNKKMPVKGAEEPGIPERTFPLLFPSAAQPRAVLPAGGELFQVTSYGTLMRQMGKNGAYWELLAEGLPAGADIFEMSRMDNGCLVLLVCHIHKREVMLFNLSDGEKKIFHSAGRPSAFIPLMGGFWCVNTYQYFTLKRDTPLTMRDRPYLLKKIRNLYHNRKTELNAANAAINYSQGVLRNVKEVLINGKNNLTFNIHELTLSHDHFTIKPNRQSAARSVVRAIRAGKYEFAFPDGSRVLCNPAGMITLKSVGGMVPPICVPSILDTSLALAAGANVTGNHQFLSTDRQLSGAIHPEEFWYQYLRPFIQNILRYGTEPPTER